MRLRRNSLALFFMLMVLLQIFATGKSISLLKLTAGVGSNLNLKAEANLNLNLKAEANKSPIATATLLSNTDSSQLKSVIL